MDSLNLKTVGVIGSRGRLGSKLVELGYLPIECDITATGSIVQSLLNLPKFDVIINCVGYTDVDGCESNPLLAYRTNSFAPRNIIDCFNGKLVHISTDYIFNGLKGKYREYDIPSPISTYGYSKYFGEIGIKGVHNVLIIRTTVLYDGKHIKDNFVKKVYNRLINNIPTTLPELFGNPTHTKHLAEGIKYCIERDLSGTINIVGKDYVNRYELGKKIAEKFNLDSKLITKGTAWGNAKRGTYMGLDTHLAESLNIPLFTLDEGLNEFKKEIINAE